MVMLSLPVILLGIIVIEQLVVIIMLIVMNCKIKNGCSKSGSTDGGIHKRDYDLQKMLSPGAASK